MGDTLEVSVSFGRYENDDALSWEKWSSFSSPNNKYLEEAEKCKTPGSVAQKKAYFEAHYKKIAAQKLEQIEKEKKEQFDQAKQIDESLPTILDLDEPHFHDHSENTQISDSRVGLSDGDEEKTRTDVNNSNNVDEPKDNAFVDVNAKEGPILETSDDGEVPKVEDNLKEIPQVDNEAMSSSAKKSKTAKPNPKNTARKVHPTTEDRISAKTKKKPVSPVKKSSRISTPMPKPVSKNISSSQQSVKKVNGVSYQRSSNAPVSQSNKVLSKSLNSPSQSSIKKLNGSTLQRSKNSSTSMYMSLSLGPPPNSTASTTTMRKSMIMERMGDKDIVKRAFKAFQNSFNQGKPEVDTRYSGSKKVLPKGSEQKISASPTPRKEVDRLRKTSDKVITQKCQSGTRSNSLSSGAPKDAGIERTKANTVRPASTRSDRSTDKLKEDITKGKIHRPGSNRCS